MPCQMCGAHRGRRPSQQISRDHFRVELEIPSTARCGCVYWKTKLQTRANFTCSSEGCGPSSGVHSTKADGAGAVGKEGGQRFNERFWCRGGLRWWRVSPRPVTLGGGQTISPFLGAACGDSARGTPIRTNPPARSCLPACLPVCLSVCMSTCLVCAPARRAGNQMRATLSDSALPACIASRGSAALGVASTAVSTDAHPASSSTRRLVSGMRNSVYAQPTPHMMA
mmetsp:Transcript_34495/g.86658  ORF Transcript_34495/g.86658 Transcript_34495/m.86658 type:complete len:226 (-) Transcript_34495:438-1115(-)